MRAHLGLLPDNVQSFIRNAMMQRNWKEVNRRAHVVFVLVGSNWEIIKIDRAVASALKKAGRSRCVVVLTPGAISQQYLSGFLPHLDNVLAVVQEPKNTTLASALLNEVQRRLPAL